MPISKENLARYPKNWKTEIVPAVRARSGDRCEFKIDGKRCEARQGEPHPVTGSKVVLTVAHLDHTPEHVGMRNLLHGCQKCHLAYDHDHHQANARTTRRGRKAIGELL